MESKQTHEEIRKVAANLHSLYFHFVNLFSFYGLVANIDLPEQTERKLHISFSDLLSWASQQKYAFKKKAFQFWHKRKKHCLRSSIVIPEIFLFGVMLADDQIVVSHEQLGNRDIQSKIRSQYVFSDLKIYKACCNLFAQFLKPNWLI